MVRNEQHLLLVCFSISILSFLVALVFYFTSLISAIMFKSIIIGAIISLLNFLIGFILFKISLRKSEKIFILSLWGGLLLRLILGLSLILITLIFLEINTYGFIFSILFFYVFYLFTEIFYLNLGRKSQFGGKQ